MKPDSPHGPSHDPALNLRLCAAGLRPTVARIAVLQAIGASGLRTLSADDVYRELMLSGTSASTGTVYRVIHELEDNGLLLREWAVNRKALYRLKPSEADMPAHRLVCRLCQRSFEFSDPCLGTRLLAEAAQQGFDLAEQALTVEVNCAHCAPQSLGASRGASLFSHLVKPA